MLLVFWTTKNSWNSSFGLLFLGGLGLTIATFIMALIQSVILFLISERMYLYDKLYNRKSMPRTKIWPIKGGHLLSQPIVNLPPSVCYCKLHVCINVTVHGWRFSSASHRSQGLVTSQLIIIISKESLPDFIVVLSWQTVWKWGQNCGVFW